MYAESDQQTSQKARAQEKDQCGRADGYAQNSPQYTAEQHATGDSLSHTSQRAHECPIPKPRGRLGTFLGFSEPKAAPENTTKVQVLDSRKGRKE